MKTAFHSSKSLIMLCLLIVFVILIGIACNVAALPPPTPTAPVGMPVFPWPPPKPSATANLNFGSLTKSAGAKLTFGDVDARIDEALGAGNYTEKSYYGIPGGFALVTHIEQINSDGSPDFSNRWVTEMTSMSLSKFSMQKYLEALFSAPKGRYRIFVFMVTSNMVISSGTPVSEGEAQAWIVEGANKLPSEIMSIPYTKDYSCTVYVYEFIQSGYGEQAIQNTPSSITGKEHLQQADLWDTLEK